MKDIYAIGIGAATFAIGCVAAGIYAVDRCNKMDDKLTGVCEGINYIQDNIDLDVPEEYAKELIKTIATDVAKRQVESAITDVKRDINLTIKKQVKDAVSTAYKSVEGEVAAKLESQINIQTIDKIQKDVTDRVTKNIIDNSVSALFKPKSDSATTTNDIVKTCIDNGMDAWDIKRVLEAAK